MRLSTVLLFVACCCSSAQAQYTYSFMAQDVFPTSGPSNGDGEVAGFVNEEDPRAITWTVANGTVVLNSDVADPRAIGAAINDLGDLVGTLYDGEPINHLKTPALWPAGGGIQHLPTLGGSQTAPNGINNNQEVVGWGATAADEVHAFRWTPIAGITDLGTHSGDFSQAIKINESGYAVGHYGAGNIDLHPIVWRPNNSVIDLGEADGFSNGSAVSVNEAGQVAVSLFNFDAFGNPIYAPYIWSENDGFESVPIPSNFDAAYAVDINDNGDVLLNAFNVVAGIPGTETAFVFTDGELIELPAPEGYDSAFYIGLNNVKWVSGIANKIIYDEFGVVTDVLDAGFIIHLPEPTTAIFTLLFLSILRRRRAASS